jgi:hypothetical protein
VIVAKPAHDFQSEVIEQKPLFIKSAVICCPDSELLKPFGLESVEVDKTLIPAAMRRRTSLTTRMAITAATYACQHAQVDSSILPTVFASLGGEIQVTDALCRLLPSPDELLSPTQFHNSVHNTTAGYWGILNHCQAPSTAIAAVDDGFAMGLLEAWSQLQQLPGDILLVCYDEEWPQYLAAPIGKIPFACALVLSSENRGNLPAISVPCRSETDLPGFKNLEGLSLENWQELVKQAPAAAAIPLLQALKHRHNDIIPLNISAILWSVQLVM